MMESASTYRAVQAVAPGRLELVRKPMRAPGPGEVRLRVEACGVGASPEPITVSGMDLIFGSRRLEGALTGDPGTGNETLRFSALLGVSAMIETAPLERAPDAYAKMLAGAARFRMVLTME